MKHLITPILLSLSLTATAQTKPGFQAITAVESTNLGREQNLLLGINPEFGYFWEKFGVTASYHQLINANRANSIGLKAYVKAVEFKPVSLHLSAEADRYIKTIDDKVRGNFEYRLGATLSVPVAPIPGLSARFSYQSLHYKQDFKKSVGMGKQKNGGSFGLSYSL